LDPFQRDALQKACDDASLLAQGWGAAQNTEALAACEDLGITVVRPSKSEIERVRPVVQSVIDEWLSRAGPSGQPLLDAISKGLEYSRDLLKH